MSATFTSLQENLHNNPMRKAHLLFFSFIDLRTSKQTNKIKVGKGNSVDLDLGTTPHCFIFLCPLVSGVNREKTQCQEALVPYKQIFNMKNS